MSVLVDTFTESSDTALGSHTPDTRPGSEVWTVSNGTMTVNAAADQVQVASTGAHRAGINYGMTGDFAVQADLSNISLTTGSTYPAVHAYISTSYDDGQNLYFQYDVNGQQFKLGYISTTDGSASDTYSVATPTGTTTMKLERIGDTANGYVNGTLRCTLSVAGTTDFSGTTLYPGISSSTFNADRPYWDDFSVTDIVTVNAGVKSVTITKYNPTVTVGSAVTVNVGVKSVTITKYNPTVGVATSNVPLQVNSSTVAVREGGHAVRYESLADHPVRNYRGTCISAITTARGYRRIWSVQTPPMTMAVAASFEADVSTGDLFTVTGYLVGSTTVTAAIANIQREDEPLFASFSFELIESI